MRPLRLFCLLLLVFIQGFAASAQQDTTKSGTPVRPVPHARASLSAFSTTKLRTEHITPETYIIVSRPQFRDAISNIAQWKRMQGFSVEELYFDTRSRDTIRAALTRRYNNATATRPAQRYVLIVGDVDMIQSFVGKHTPDGLSSSVTDLYYGEYTGDYIPESYVGRISSSDTAQVKEIINKTIAYEQGYWARHGMHTRAILTAGTEDRSPAPTTTNGQINHLKTLAANCGLDTECFYNPQSANQRTDIIQALNQGNALVNYTAHCTRSGWNNPNISYAALDTLDHASPTLFINNCCLSNAFDATCFGEEILRKPDGGAAGVIGATNETFWVEDFYWTVGAHYPISITPIYDSTRPGAFEPLFNRPSFDQSSTENVCLGAMLQSGCRAVTLAGSRYDAFYWETYNLLGDPSLVPFIGEADSLPLQLSATPYSGDMHLSVRTAPFARVTAVQDSILLASTDADSNGVATLTCCRAILPDSLTITATRTNGLPSITTIQIPSTLGGRIAIRSASLADSSLTLSIANSGLSVISDCQLTITQTAEDGRRGATISGADTIHIDFLAPEQDTNITFNLQSYSPHEQLIYAHLTILTEDSTTSIPFHLALGTTLPLISSIHLFTPDSLPAKQIKDNCQYTLAVEFQSTTDSATYAITCCHISDTSVHTGICYNSESARFDFSTRDSMMRLIADITIHKGTWDTTYRYYLLPYISTADFETDESSSYPWVSPSIYPWVLDSTHQHKGHYSLRSSQIGHTQKSVISIDLNVLEPDTLAFYFRVSSEASDWFYINIDGRNRGYWSGNKNWERFAWPLTSGKHHIEWQYIKDASINERDDCAWIDDIRFPLCLWSEPCGLSERGPSLLQLADRHFDTRHINIYPNPASKAVNITVPSDSYQFEVYDSFGRLVQQLPLNKTVREITQYSVAHLRSGIYTITIKSMNGISCQKLIIAH